MSSTVLKAEGALPTYDPSSFTFAVKAKIVGQAQEVDGYGILNGAQNNADLLFKVTFSYAAGQLSFDVFDFVVECAGDPWSNLMENKDVDTGEPVGRGFGKETNKYSWTMIEYKDALIDGTKNAYYNLLDYINPGGNIATCVNNPPAPGGFEYPEIYWRFACMEVFGYGDDNIWSTDGAEIWRLNYKNNRWMKVYDAGPDGECIDNTTPLDTTCSAGSEFAQGFRNSIIYDGVLYVAVDLGAFISGVSYTNMFTYPGVALLRSTDGINFEVVPNCGTGAGQLCESQMVFPPGGPTNNVSIRSLAVHNNLLYIGTLNNGGGKLYTYDGTDFEQVWDAGPQYPIVGELEEYDDKLYIGLGGLLTVNNYPSNDYLWMCDLCDEGAVPTDDFAPVDDLPNIDPASLFVIKLFAAQGKLFIGTVNFEHGFSFLSYNVNADPGEEFDIIVDGPIGGGMFDRDNIYLWSAAGPINGRIFIGTFKPISDDPPRLAELYYSDDGGVNWAQFPMPINWSPLGYGIRDMVVGDKGKSLFLGSATLMPAPNILTIPNPLQAGTEVWEIRDTKVASPSTDTVTKGKGKGPK